VDEVENRVVVAAEEAPKVEREEVAVVEATTIRRMRRSKDTKRMPQREKKERKMRQTVRKQ